jgi:hypothetical protein
MRKYVIVGQMRGWELLLGSVVCLCSTAGVGWTADSPSPLGRVSAVVGAVQYHSTGAEWSAGLVNEPVAEGTGLRTAADAEAELDGLGARVALAPSSELQVVRFDKSTLQIALSSGRIGVHVGPFDVMKTVEIDLPQGGIWLDAPGDYDITAGDAQAPVAVEVFAGGARFGGGLDASHIHKPEGDWFSGWWHSQDDNADLSAPALPALPGAAVLAATGRWELDSKLGNVWFPSDVPADWVPYRDGVWRYLPPWGWTWVDNAPWGFAPSHYGRWARVDGKWGWAPGDRVAAANYSPAVVAFLGTARIGLSRPGDIGATPAVAWFPLAPDEKIGDADGNYTNRSFTTAMARTGFIAGQPVASAIVGDIPKQRFIDAPVILGALGISPAGTPVAAVAPAKPAETTVATASGAAGTATQAAPDATAAREPFVVALHDAPARIVRVVHEVRRKLRLAAAAVLRLRAHPPASARRGHALASTHRPHPLTSAFHARALASTYHSPHNRRHLAAARGGA